MQRILFILAISLLALSCKSSEQSRLRYQAIDVEESDKFKIEGRVIRKGVIKNMESWVANRRPYYVLDVAGASFVKYSAEQGMILYPAGDVTYELLESFVNKRVEAYGAYVPESTLIKAPSRFAYDGKVRKQGEGFFIYKIELMD